MPINERTLALLAQMGRGVDGVVDSTTRALTANWSTAWHEISSEWLAAAEVVVATPDPSPHHILNLNRTQRALAIAGGKLGELSDEFEEMVREPLEQVTQFTATMSDDLARSQMPDRGLGPGVGVTFTSASPEALEHIVNRTMGNVHSARLPLADDAITAMKSSLIRAVPAGWGPERAAREMLRRSRSAFNGGLSRALTIARTEMLDAHRAAARAADMANETVRGWRWFAHLDAHVCPSCVAMHGTEYPPEEEGPLDHQNGRCTRVPLTLSWRDLGFDMDEPDDDFESAADWIARAPHEAVSALGPERMLMLNDGTISISDMSMRKENPDWRASYHATPLTDLRKRTP